MAKAGWEVLAGEQSRKEARWESLLIARPELAPAARARPFLAPSALARWRTRTQIGRAAGCMRLDTLLARRVLQRPRRGSTVGRVASTLSTAVLVLPELYLPPSCLPAGWQRRQQARGTTAAKASTTVVTAIGSSPSPYIRVALHNPRTSNSIEVPNRPPIACTAASPTRCSLCSSAWRRWRPARTLQPLLQPQISPPGATADSNIGGRCRALCFTRAAGRRTIDRPSP